MLRVVVLSGILLLSLASVVSGQNGAVEIYQTNALRAGVTNGDTAGFAVTISQRGSYKVTSKLTNNDSP